eukprot:TRINITY_DN2817_c0_g1_i2.p1 TRINITY_DN2817_c0_g1~~TRINITY_DN2817_c0_g1_i2.p1  ORF type:complete len:171 (+),score=32.64 TRINITY_DN2817_c0_g1_i2:171-683(+)
MKGDPYSVLGVLPGATPDEVKLAYRKLALQFHPDVSSGDSKKFRQITEAYEQLLSSRSGKGSAAHPTAHYPASSGPGSFHAGAARYASLYRGLGGRATTIWGVGLALGCVLFGVALLIGRTDMYTHNLYQQHGARRALLPSEDLKKRERIARILLEKSKELPTAELTRRH